MSQTLVDHPRIDPEMRSALLETSDLDGAPAETPAEMRRAYARERAHWNHPLPSMKTVDKQRIDGPHGELPLQLLHPPVPGPTPVIVYAHGGGWVVGNLATHARIMRVLAERSGAVVVGVDYQLSPEVALPVALDEVCAAVQWLRENGTPLGIDVERIALAGDSAGANLVAAAAVRLNAEAAPGSGPVRALGLLYGVYGLAGSDSMRALGDFDAGLSAAAVDFYYRSYLGDAASRDDPRVNLLNADVRQLPPSLLIAAELDPLLDDSHAFAAHLGAAGVDARLEVAPGLVHGFAHMTRSVTEARRQVYDLAAWLAQRLVA